MKIDEISIDAIHKLKEEAYEKRQEFHKLRLEKQQKKENDFLTQLALSVQLFSNKLIEKTWKELQDCASKGYTRKKFYFENFKERIGPIKISTLVKGFHIQENWDKSIFLKIGMDKTPFEQVVEDLGKKGILLKDVSDISKGTGFWLEVSFIPLH